MTDADPAAADAPDDRHDPPIRNQDGVLTRDFVAIVTAAIQAEDETWLRALAADMHEADVAEVLDALPFDYRLGFITLLGNDFDILALTELDDNARAEILEVLPNSQLAEAVQELDSDDAVDIIDALSDDDQSEVLSFMPAAERVAIQRSLDYDEDSAGRLMQKDFIAVPPFWTVGDAIDHARENADLPDEFYELFVVDPRFRFVGTVPLNRLLRTKRPVKIEDIMDPPDYSVGLAEDQEEVARLFGKYNLVSVPVLDNGERLVGVITIDDVVDVINEENEEDMKRLAGLGDEDISDTVVSIVRYRFPWLLVNLLTAIAASAVIALFEDVIAQVVALAVLMPIVASMGGNAGTQSLTVAVRAIATRDLTSSNARRIVFREAVAAMLNGFAFAIIMGVLGGIWSGNGTIGLILGIAMIVNMLVAGLAGVLVPITLDKLKLDPAVSSSVFVTTVTDMVGFFAFLGMAALAFGLL